MRIKVCSVYNPVHKPMEYASNLNISSRQVFVQLKRQELDFEGEKNSEIEKIIDEFLKFILVLFNNGNFFHYYFCLESDLRIQLVKVVRAM